MLYFSRWKAIGILLTTLVVCAFAIPNFFPETMVRSWPQWAQRHIVLGLDLQGGVSILLEVDAAGVRKDKVNTLREDVIRVARESRLGSNPTIRGNTVEFRVRQGVDPALALQKLRELSQPMSGVLSTTGQRTVDVVDAGNGLIRLTPTEPAIVERIRQAVEQSMQVLEKRLNFTGTVEPSIQRQGVDRILVQVPGLSDPQQILDILNKTAKLEFRMVDQSVPAEQVTPDAVPPDSELLKGAEADKNQLYLIEKRVLVSGADLTDAQPGFDQRTSEPIVSFKFNNSGARRFAQVTTENVGKPFAMGAALVVVFMFVTYGLFGLFANIAVLFNVAMIFGVLSLLNATLTLPGIAGVVLTVGIAVDSNVLIYERIREEVRAGRTPISAIDAGFSRALATIMDSNITTFIAAAVLFYVGTGPVRGFAVTLGIGIVTTVFTAFTLTRLIVAMWVRWWRPKTVPI